MPPLLKSYLAQERVNPGSKSQAELRVGRFSVGSLGQGIDAPMLRAQAIEPAKVEPDIDRVGPLVSPEVAEKFAATLSQATFRIAEEKAKLASLDATNAAMSDLNQMLYGSDDGQQSGYLSLTGRSYIDKHPEAMQSVNAIVAKHAESLDPYARKMFMTSIQDNALSTKRTLAQYSNHQLDVWRKTTYDETADMAKRSILKDLDNEPEFEANLAKAVTKVQETFSSNPQLGELMGKQLRDSVYKDAIEVAKSSERLDLAYSMTNKAMANEAHPEVIAYGLNAMTSIADKKKAARESAIADDMRNARYQTFQEEQRILKAADPVQAWNSTTNIEAKASTKGVIEANQRGIEHGPADAVLQATQAVMDGEVTNIQQLQARFPMLGTRDFSDLQSTMLSRQDKEINYWTKRADEWLRPLTTGAAGVNRFNKDKAEVTYINTMRQFENALATAKMEKQPASKAFLAVQAELMTDPNLDKNYPGMSFSRESVIFPTLPREYNLLPHEDRFTAANPNALADLKKTTSEALMRWQQKYYPDSADGNIPYVPGQYEEAMEIANQIHQQYLYFKKALTQQPQDTTEQKAQPKPGLGSKIKSMFNQVTGSGEPSTKED